MGTCASSQNNKNHQNLTHSLKKFLKSSDFKPVDNTTSENCSNILCANTGSFFDKKNSVILAGLWIAEKVMRNVNSKTLNLNYNISNFIPKLKLGDNCDKNENENFFKEQLVLNEQFQSILKVNDLKEVIKYKDDCTYLTFSSCSNNLSLALNDIDEIINNKNLSFEFQEKKTRKSISMNKPLFHLHQFRKDLKSIKKGAFRNSEKFRKKSSFHLDKFIKVSNFSNNNGRNSLQLASNRSLNLTTNIRSLPNNEENNFSVNNTGNSRRNSLSKQFIKDTISTERNRKTFIKGKNEQFDKISEKNESMTILKTNKKLSSKKPEKIPKINAKRKNSKKKSLIKVELRKKIPFTKEPSKKTLTNIKKNYIYSNLKVQDYNLPNIEFSSPKNFFISSELKKGNEVNNNKSNESKGAKINHFNLNSQEIMNKKGIYYSSQEEEEALFSIKPLGEKTENQEAEYRDIQNDDIVNYQHFLKSVAIQKSINKDYHYIKIDLRKLGKENLHSKPSLSKRNLKNSSSNILLKKTKTYNIPVNNNTQGKKNTENILYKYLFLFTQKQ
jgi:hypothetical protein